MKGNGQVCLTLKILEFALVVSWKWHWPWTIDGDMPFEEAEGGVVAIHADVGEPLGLLYK